MPSAESLASTDLQCFFVLLSFFKYAVFVCFYSQFPGLECVSVLCVQSWSSVVQKKVQKKEHSRKTQRVVPFKAWIIDVDIIFNTAMLKIKTKKPLCASHRCLSPENLWNWHSEATREKIPSSMPFCLRGCCQFQFFSKRLILSGAAIVRAETTFLCEDLRPAASGEFTGGIVCPIVPLFLMWLVK